ncbi:MAG: hypothetical protein E7397_02045 [Ruminococcaceae bacterium]|nr:hypothetical protein [Oscillospiraceae bacterium]
MILTISEQATVFLQMILLGVGSGILFDCFRALHRTVFRGVVSVGISDFLFWMSETGLIGAGIYLLHSGSLRFFVILGLVLGQILYFLLVSRVVCTIFVWFIGRLLKIFKVFFKILLTPAQLLYKILIVPIFSLWDWFLRAKKCRKKPAENIELREQNADKEK